jgi:protein O-mannosyl-transferase
MTNTAQPISAAHPSGQAGTRKQAFLLCLLLALVTAAVYWPVARHGFINFDDPDYVSGNPRVQVGLTWESVQWAFTTGFSSNWHPLTWLSHMLDCQLYGLTPGGHHLTNLLFHIANSLLLFGLFQRMTGALWRSALVAALFALHPLHVESVAWVSERKDVLSTFFGLLCLWAYVKYAEAQTLRPRFWYFVALLLFALGLMSKPMLVTLPCLLLLLDYWPLRRPSLPPLRLLLEKVPFFALSALSCVVTFLVQQASGAVTPLAKSPFDLRLANAFIAYALYLGKTLWPSKLAVFYPYSRWSLDSWPVVAAALLLVAATVAVVLLRKQKPYLLVGWLWFCGTLVPVIGLVQVGKQSWADRYTYLPHIGLFLLIVWGISEVVARWKWSRPIAIAAAGLALAACGLATVRQRTYWRNTKTLFEHALAVTSDNYVAYTVVGNALIDDGKLPEAIEQCQRALQISPDYPEAHNTLGNIYTRQQKYTEATASYNAAIRSDPTYADAHAGLSDALIKQGDFAGAEAHGREALRLTPMHLPAMFCLATALHKQNKLAEAADYYRQILALNPNLFTPHRYLGNVLVAQGKPQEAAAQFQMALKIRPADIDTRVVLGVMLLGNNRTDEAAAQFREAVRLQPTNSLANYQLALIHQGRKEPRPAIEYFRQALQAQPDWAESLNNLAWILAANPDATLRNGPEAVTLAERACQLTNYKEAFLIGTLAAAYAEAGRFPEAVTAAEKARTIALAAGQKEVAQSNLELLELYKAGRAYHEAP